MENKEERRGVNITRGAQEETGTGTSKISQPFLNVNSNSNGAGHANDRHGYAFANLPEVLRALPQWGVFRAEWQNEKLKNVPYAAGTGAHLSVTDASTWCDHATALAVYQQGTRGQWDGVNFVVTTENGMVGLDVDDCIDEHGDLTTEAREIVDLWQSYVEYSPSRRSIRGFAYGTLPAGKRHTGKFEIYSTGKVFTVTGWHLAGTPTTIEERSEAIADIHARFIQAKKKPQPTKSTSTFPDEDSEPLEDEEVIALALQAKNGARVQSLIDGDLAGYASTSEADLAVCNYLAFYCGRNSHEQIDRIFRAHFAFFRLEKWDARHYGSGETYGEHTIKVALEGRSEFYHRPLVWHPSAPEEPAPHTDEADADERADFTAEEPDEPEEMEELEDDAPPDARRRFFHLTDLGNGERMVARYGENLRFCNPWKKWLAWDGTRWRIDHVQQVQKWARATVRALYRDCAAFVQRIKRETDKKKRKALIKQHAALLKHAVNSENGARVAAMVQLAQMDVPIMPEQLDSNPWLLNVKNGTLDLQTGELQPHTRKDLLTKFIPIDYDEEASCPQWEDFLESIMNGNQAVIAFLQSAIGYSLTGDVREDCLFLLHGSGANGKSTFLTILRALLDEYGKQAAFSTFLHQERETVRNDLADLQGARLVVASETDEGKRLSMSVVKALTGKDFIKARFLFAEYFEYAPQMKLWLAANHKPVITGTDYAIWRRIRLIPFTQKFEGESDDKQLGDKLKAELQGILAWAVRGCLEWQKNELPTPEAVKSATEDYRAESDVIGGFLEECCRVQSGLQTSAGNLLEAFKSYSSDKNFTHQKMKAALEEKGFIRQRSSLTGHMMWQGIGILLANSTENDDS